jgi:hypothetical protein
MTMWNALLRLDGRCHGSVFACPGALVFFPYWLWLTVICRPQPAAIRLHQLVPRHDPSCAPWA